MIALPVQLVVQSSNNVFHWQIPVDTELGYNGSHAVCIMTSSNLNICRVTVRSRLEFIGGFSSQGDDFVIKRNNLTNTRLTGNPWRSFDVAVMAIFRYAGACHGGIILTKAEYCRKCVHVMTLLWKTSVRTGNDTLWDSRDDGVGIWVWWMFVERGKCDFPIYMISWDQSLVGSCIHCSWKTWKTSVAQ